MKTNGINSRAIPCLSCLSNSEYNKQKLYIHSSLVSSSQLTDSSVRQLENETQELKHLLLSTALQSNVLNIRSLTTFF